MRTRRVASVSSAASTLATSDHPLPSLPRSTWTTLSPTFSCSGGNSASSSQMGRLASAQSVLKAATRPSTAGPWMRRWVSRQWSGSSAFPVHSFEVLTPPAKPTSPSTTRTLRWVRLSCSQKRRLLTGRKYSRSMPASRMAATCARASHREPMASRSTRTRTPARARSHRASANSETMSPVPSWKASRSTVDRAARMASSMAGNTSSPLRRTSTRLPSVAGMPMRHSRPRRRRWSSSDGEGRPRRAVVATGRRYRSVAEGTPSGPDQHHGDGTDRQQPGEGGQGHPGRVPGAGAGVEGGALPQHRRPRPAAPRQVGRDPEPHGLRERPPGGLLQLLLRHPEAAAAEAIAQPGVAERLQAVAQVGLALDPPPVAEGGPVALHHQVRQGAVLPRHLGHDPTEAVEGAERLGRPHLHATALDVRGPGHVPAGRLEVLHLQLVLEARDPTGGVA